MDGEFRQVTLDDKYEVERGAVFISGTQALARLPILQRRRDLLNGLNTAGFICGYRGSPIGGLDMTLWRIKDRLQQNEIVFQPGLNEELAATAVAGSQQFAATPNPRFDGVFSMWYGKGPGVDRAMDALKHGNFAGVHPNGGVILAYGDDHPGKSSTVAHQSEQALSAQLIPSLYPSAVEEYLEYGLLSWAMSRFSGAWVGLKCVNETIEQTATCEIDLPRFSYELPEAEIAEPGVHYRGTIANRILNEEIALERRLPLVLDFVRANKIDRCSLRAASPRLGLVCAGKTYQDVMRAMDLLGIPDDPSNSYGISIYKVGCIWPLETEGLLSFANGQRELFVVEEKKPFVEAQIASLLVNRRERPALSGKNDPEGAPLLSPSGQLDPQSVALAIADRLEALGLADEPLKNRAAALRAEMQTTSGAPPAIRAPYFCSGCPHNRSTKVPDDSHAMAGTGCATMEVFFRPERIVPAQMGGEGSSWIGMAPFTGTDHIFQNMGDGTYYHSGLLSVRAAIAASVNITFKLLYNDAVAMTGGQPVDGPLSVADITYQVLHEGVVQCVVVSDAPEKYNGQSGLAPGVKVYHRDDLDQVQRNLREVKGCTFLIYEQTCAAEKRRRRKKNAFPNPKKRLYINPAVCEGCGDCSTKANCVSILPLETRFGVKRQIDQHNCNKDYSCALGFCPSFVTVLDAEPRKPDTKTINPTDLTSLPDPLPKSTEGESINIMLAGIGGTGVVTAAAVLGMAAHLEGRASSVFDMTGLAQKNGAVYSHLKIANKTCDIKGSAIARHDADLILGFDLVAASNGDSVGTISENKSWIVGNSDITPTAAFQRDRNAKTPDAQIHDTLSDGIAKNQALFFNATDLAEALCGNALGSNFLLIGYALQKGLLPISVQAVNRAIELNGVSVDFNKNALAIGRLAAQRPDLVDQVTSASVSEEPQNATLGLEALIEHRAAHLTAYQNKSLSDRYRALVARVAEAEKDKAPGADGLACAVAENYAKLLSYKDEYEVGRLYSEPAFLENIKRDFEGEPKLKFNLAPPLLSRPDPVTGEHKKMEFGAWILPGFKALAAMRFLRGTPFDIFGYNEERRQERKLIADYEQQVDQVLAILKPENHALALELLQLPNDIRGFGPVKKRAIDQAEKRAKALLEGLNVGA